MDIPAHHAAIIERAQKGERLVARGMALNLIDYIGDFPALRDEVLPRLERLGLRRPVMAGSSRSR